MGGYADIDYMNEVPLCLLSFSRPPVKNVSILCCFVLFCLVECEDPSFSDLGRVNTLPILRVSP